MPTAPLVHDLLTGLTSAQRSAVEHRDGPCLVIAGAGTGKTRVIAHRVAYLISQGVPPEKILALTFTDKSAGEMEERIDQLLPYGVFGTTIATFHGYCGDLLRRYAYLLGIAQNFTILSSADEISFLRQHLDELPATELLRPQHPSGEVLRKLLTFSHRAKEEILLPETILEYTGRLLANPGETAETHEMAKEIPDEAALAGRREFAQLLQEYALLYQASRHIYHQHSVLSYADLILEALLLLRTHPSVLAAETSRFDYLLLDEFQDTNSAQHEVARAIGGRKANVMAVGDDDQAIYRFRGANLTNLLHFRDHYPGCRTITLTDNFRSGQEILDTAYRLIQHNNPDRLEVVEGVSKRLRAQVTPVANAVQYRHFTHCTYEYAFVADRIRELLDSGQYAPQEIAVLLRARAHGHALQAALRNRGIPFRYNADIRFFSLPSIQTAISYLRFLAAPHNAHNLFYLLCQSPFQADTATLARYLQEADYRKHSLYEYLLNLADAPAVIRESIAYLHNNLGAATSRVPSQLLLEFFHSSGWYDQLIQANDHLQTEQLAALFQEVQKYETGHPNTRLTEYVEHVDRLIDSDEDISVSPAVGEGDTEGVHLMTIHQSKGLEFRAVFLTNLIQGRFPGNNRSDGVPFPYELTNLPPQDKENALAEERRLMYVAMTRAREHLFLTASELYEDRKTKAKISIFLREALGDATNWDMPAVSGALPPLQAPPTPNPDAPSVNPGHADEPVFPLPERLSASSLEAYAKCPQQYKFEHILKVRVPSSSAANFGSSLHGVLCAWHTARERGDVPDLERLFRDHWISGGYETRKREEQAYQDGLRQVREYLTAVGETYPLLLEYAVRYRLPDGTVITGKIDRVDRISPAHSEENGYPKVRLIDYKTGHKAPARKGLKDNLPLRVYAAALAQSGYPVEEIELHYIMPGVVVQATPSQINLDKVAADTAALVQDIKTSTATDSFPATPSPVVCGTCLYKHICPFRWGKE
jgi:DNA helicase-2/ATP-dependent DNA helicase PcrA